MIGAYKITQEQVEEIRELIAQGLSDSSIAEKYKVSREHINCIRNGRRWNPKKNSFLMKSQIKGQFQMENFAIVRMFKDDVCVNAFNIKPEDIVNYTSKIDSVFENQSGGWSINIRIDL